MRMEEVSVPEVYKRESADFRFFLEWFQDALAQIQYDTTNFFDLLDPLRCPSNLLWMLADTMGFKQDDRLPVAFNRLVLLYFMSMIRNRGSNNGITLAAETNLAQFNIINYGKEKSILTERLEDTSIPVNSVYVQSNVEMGFIEVVYFSTKKPIDACIEYVRPLGMYIFQYAGVRMDARTKISIDARLTDSRDEYYHRRNSSVWDPRFSDYRYHRAGPTHVGPYSRDDYARMQQMKQIDLSDMTPEERYYYKQYEREIILDSKQGVPDSEDTRKPVWYRNSRGEVVTDPSINPGLRALESLQLTNNEHIVESLLEPIFSLGLGLGPDYPVEVSTSYPDDYLKPPYKDYPPYNLRYNRDLEEALREASLGVQHFTTDKNGNIVGTSYHTWSTHAPDIYTLEPDRPQDTLGPNPKVNPIMYRIGDAMPLDTVMNTGKENETFTKRDADGNYTVVDGDGNPIGFKPDWK